MNIGFFLIPYQRFSGAGQYYHSLFREVSKIDSKNSYTVFLPSDVERSALDFFGKERCVVTNIPSNPGALRYIRTMASMCVEKHVPRVSLLHCFNFPLPRFSGKTILTMYDLREYDLPHVYSASHRFFSLRIHPPALKRVDHIITISDFSAQRIKQHFPFCSQKVSRVYLGLDTPGAAVHSRPHSNPYILTVGHITRHKNHETLIKAFNMLCREPNFKHDLVIVGYHYNNLKYYEELKELVERKERVVFAGRVSDEQTDAFYAHADLFAFPSLYEGFGLPLLEAFYFGVPVAASRIPTFEELYGVEEALFSPQDPADCCRVIKLILDNKELKERIVSTGHEIAQQFLSSKTARETLALYEKVHK